MSKVELVKKVKAKKINSDCSTIYRELQSLIKNVIIKHTIAGIDFYEIPDVHHHDLVRMSCNSISKVEIGNYLEKQKTNR